MVQMDSKNTLMWLIEKTERNKIELTSNPEREGNEEHVHSEHAAIDSSRVIVAEQPGSETVFACVHEEDSIGDVAKCRRDSMDLAEHEQLRCQK